ncbi:nicotinamide riboside transporter PnuC [Pedobacter puniceum]|uniref:Nicotinamide riboside transporter PnuC n=1 Tax=Pedobacter puniceum TaxID=2666136 RepID=A0A7K0FP73_9SPHI|nr:nicotinamide riboside transporter PnuC [Pedobacter puniceum]MRX47683.1 nicotinamide riboside transporter PnuC [Pedobacter puniceum]
MQVLQEIIQQFKAISYLEWFGVITGALCVYLAAKENILNWPVSILSVLTYIYIFYEAKLYGDTILQFYFLSTAIYGWYYWSYGQNKSLKSERPVTKLTKNEWLLATIVLLSASITFGYLLDDFTDSDVPYIDGFCTATSFIAQFLMTRKKLENWLIWILVDAVYIPLYIHKDLMATALLYFVFLFIALKGYLDWKKNYKLYQQHE